MPGPRRHAYATFVRWGGAASGTTATYAGYSREHEIRLQRSGVTLRTSADGTFRGDPALPNPEDLLVASLSSCHLLSYLAVCALAKIEVLSYVDEAHGVMEETGGAGRFVSVELAPHVVIARAEDLSRAEELHAEAHAACFIANSVNFPVTHVASVVVATGVAR